MTLKKKEKKNQSSCKQTVGYFCYYNCKWSLSVPVSYPGVLGADQAVESHHPSPHRGRRS